MANRLAEETSPYLLQHAGNPVDWYPWGEEAFERARAEDKPILLSIGYSACHWCHVMAHESFENYAIASLMNDNFTNIKVDREERPDLDTIYMDAVQAMTGRGGWPLTVFLTPEGKPFFGGTYFPPEDRQGVPGFHRVLMTVADAYRTRGDEIETAVNQLVTVLASKPRGGGDGEPLASDVLSQAYLALQKDFDTENGGFGFAPKFPQPMALEFLLRYFYRTRDAKALEMVNSSLNKMAAGGIYDQIGGGFHRYSTDNKWLVPHFEKMLYDNALLSRIYLYAYLVTGNQLFRSVVMETIDYVIREMTASEGGFYSTQDADSDGIEGKYYLWTPQEVIEVLGEENGRLVIDYFNITEEGNFDGNNILHIVKELEQQESGLIDQAKKSLLQRREKRVSPGRDDKVIASWNGLMLGTLAEAACAFNRRDYLDAAVANGLFLIDSMLVDRSILHTCKDGQAKLNGYLDDHAMVIDGLLSLHQATLRGKWLRQAITLAETMIEQFWDETSNMFYDTGQSHEDLFVRPQSTFDGAMPSGSSMATLVLLKLGELMDNRKFEDIASKALRTARDLITQHPLGFSYWLCALDFYLSEPKQIAVIGSIDHPLASELIHTICTTWLPNKVVAALDPNDPTYVSGLTLFNNRTMLDNQPTVYVCRRYSCQRPVNDPDSLKAQLQD